MAAVIQQRPIGRKVKADRHSTVTSRGNPDGSTSTDVAMRPIRTIAPPRPGPPRPDHGGLSASQRPHDHGGADPSRAGRTHHDPDRPGHAAQPTPRPAPAPTPTGPVAGDHRRPLAGQDPCPGQGTPGQRRCRPPAVAVVGRVRSRQSMPRPSWACSPVCGAGGSGRLPGPLPPRRVEGHALPGAAGAPRQRRVGRDPGRGPSGRVAARAPDRNLVLWVASLPLLGQRRGQCSTLRYLVLP
jgi:hypothetical protein